MSSATSIRKMTSATSTKKMSSVRLQPDITGADIPGPDVPVKDAGFRPWHFFVLASLMAATAAVIMSKQSTPEHLILISITIAAAGFAAAGFYRTLAPLAETDATVIEQPLSDRMRASLEREKALALRSIKELEFDRAMGKLSAKDFDEMAGRLRSRALGLMKQLDERDPGYRALIERDLDMRLAQRKTAHAKPAPATSECAGCGTANDADAAFCKRCGRRIAEA